ncbi:MAG: TspO/MBR family protein [Nanoarchaeota archaeon]
MKESNREKHIFVFLICLLIVFSAGFFGSLFTKNVNTPWYEKNKPGITPSNWVFGLAWTILYLLIALSLFLAWTKAKTNEKKKIALIFGINLFANALWSYFFFGLQNAGLAFADLIIILITIPFMIFISGKIDKKAGWLLVPYLIWVTFAGILNFWFLV